MKEPWYRKQTNSWYVEIHGKQVPHGKHPFNPPGKPKEPPPNAAAAWHERMRTGLPKSNDILFSDVAKEYIESLAGESVHINKAARYQLTHFQKFLGKDFPAKELLPLHLTRYFRTKDWAPSSIRSCTDRVMAALNHAGVQGMLEKNPLSPVPGFKRPGRYEKRKKLLTASTQDVIEQHASPRLLAFLRVLRDSGASPGELCGARGADREVRSTNRDPDRPEQDGQINRD